MDPYIYVSDARRATASEPLPVTVSQPVSREPVARAYP
jgi:hypothetical protein